MEKQVERGHYDFRKYGHLSRWVSYYHQLDEVLAIQPENVLEVGVGDKVFGSYLKNNTNVEYRSLDIAEDLDPDVLGSVEEIPLPDGSFDVVVAFEVLEHLPFERFEAALKEIARVSRTHVIISLPHFGPPLKLGFKVPFVREIEVACKVPFAKKHEFNGQHYWEIGKRGYSPKKIKKILSKYFVLKRDYIPYGSQYHHFYILEKKNG